MIAVEQVTNCPGCGSWASSPAAPCEDRLSGVIADLEYSRCNGCRVVFLSRRVKESDIAKLYPETYHPYQAGRGFQPADARSLRYSLAQAVLRGVGRASGGLRRVTAEHYMPSHPGARFVDFGCGSPAFLDRAAQMGWTAIGVDFAPTVVDRVHEAGYEGYLVEECWEALGRGSVAALRLNHVLEHLYDPWATMRQLTSLLAQGGRLHIAVPNPDGVGALLFGRDWLSFDARHTVLFGPRQAGKLISKLGFSNIRVIHEIVTKDLARSWGYRRARQGQMALPEVFDLSNRSGLNALMAPPATIAALLRRGDRFHIFATK